MDTLYYRLYQTSEKYQIPLKIMRNFTTTLKSFQLLEVHGLVLKFSAKEETIDHFKL